MGCGISSNSPVVTKRLAGRTSRVEDISPFENSKANQRAHSSTSLDSVNHPNPSTIYNTSNYIGNSNLNKNQIINTSDPNSPDLTNHQIDNLDQSNQFNPLLAKNQRGITAVISKSLSTNKQLDALEGESDHQTGGKESVETNNSRNDSNGYGSSYSADMSKTPVSLFFKIFHL